MFAAEDVAAAALQPFRYTGNTTMTNTEFKWVKWKDDSRSHS